MLDLDEIQKRIDVVPGIPDDHTTWWWISTHDAPALVAELRAAREVIAALKRWAAIEDHYFGDTVETGVEIGWALAAYEKFAGEAPQ